MSLSDQLRALISQGLTQSEALACFAATDAADVIEAARAKYASDDLEIDDSPMISEGDGGAWVAAWVWVYSDTGEPWKCPACGCTDQDGSDSCVDCGAAISEDDEDNFCPSCGEPIGQDHADDCDEEDDEDEISTLEVKPARLSKPPLWRVSGQFCSNGRAVTISGTVDGDTSEAARESVEGQIHTFDGAASKIDISLVIGA